MPFSYDDFDLSGIHTYPLASRKSKANAADSSQSISSATKVKPLASWWE